MRTQPIASLLVAAAVVVSACSDDRESCADGECSSGPGGSSSGPTTTTSTTSSGSSSGSTGQGGSGGTGEPLDTEVVFTSAVTGEPLAGETVVVNAADGSVVSQTVTGADGRVPVEIPAGGSVSVFYSYSIWFQGTEYPIKNALTVYPGDAQPVRIALQDGAFNDPEPSAGRMGLVVGWDAVVEAAEYLIKTNCMSTMTSAPYLGGGGPTNNCTNDGLYDVVLAAQDEGGVLLDYSVLTDQPFMETQVQHDMTWTNAEVGDIPYAVTNLPDTTLEVEITSVATRQAHGAPISLEQSVLHDLPDGQVSGSVKHAMGFGDKHCANITVFIPGLAGVSYGRCDATPNLLPIAVDASRLARFSFNAQATATSASWVEGFRGEQGDLLSVTLIDYADDAPVDTRWTAFVAPGAGSLTRPDIPAGLDDYVLPEVDRASVANVDIHDETGFAAALEAGPSSPNYESAFNAN